MIQEILKIKKIKKKKKYMLQKTLQQSWMNKSK